MNSLLIPKVVRFVQGMNVGIQSVTEYAPGVVGVLDTYGDKGGELDVYFDMTRWTTPQPQMLDNFRINARSMDEIGRIQEASFGGSRLAFALCLEALIVPVDEEHGWYESSRKISLDEFGGLEMIGQAPHVDRVGWGQRALRFLGIR